MARYLSKTIPSTSSFENSSRNGVVFGIKEIKDLSSYMTDRIGVPFNHFPLSFLKRRLSYIFRKHNLRNIEQLKQLLDTDDYLERLHTDFAVNTSEMFRDPGFWRYLRSLLKSLSISDKINVWFPESASGEEVFSFLIIIDELELTDKFNITCQHSSLQRLNNIKKGILENKNLEVNKSNYTRIEGQKTFEDYYTINNNRFVLNQSLLENIEIVHGHFLTTTAPSEVGIILFRNKMLYYDKEISENCIDKLMSSLLSGGVIAIGAKEQMPESFEPGLNCLNIKEKTYKKYGFEIIWENEQQ